MKKPVKFEKSPARRKPRQLRARQTVEAVLDAVTRVLKREGPTSVTTNHIAERAGVSIGTLYQYFPDKQAIFIALHQRHVDEVDRLIRRTLAEHAASPLNVLIAALMDALIAVHSTDAELYELLQGQVPHHPDGIKPFAVRLHGDFLLAIASRAHQTRKSLDWNKAAFVVVNMVESLAHGAVLRRPPGVSLKDAQNESIQAICSYINTLK